MNTHRITLLVCFVCLLGLTGRSIAAPARLVYETSGGVRFTVTADVNPVSPERVSLLADDPDIPDRPTTTDPDVLVLYDYGVGGGNTAVDFEEVDNGPTFGTTIETRVEAAVPAVVRGSDGAGDPLRAVREGWRYLADRGWLVVKLEARDERDRLTVRWR